MSQHTSPRSSAAAAQSSSPFAGTDVTAYSPEFERDAKQRRNALTNISTMIAREKAVKTAGKVAKYKVLPQPADSVEGAFVNELAEDDKDYISRYQFVAQLPDGTNAGMDEDHELFSIQHQMKLYACFSSCVPFYARGVYLRFDDLREAAEAKDILEQHDFTVNYVTGYQFALAKTQDTAQLNEFEGQIQLSIMIEPNPEHAVWEFSEADYAELSVTVERICGVFGTLRNIIHVETIESKMLLTFRVEFHSVDAAHRASHSLRIDPIWGLSHEKTFQWVSVNPALWSGERPVNSPHRIKPRVDDQGRFVGYRPAANPFGGHPYYRHPADQHNRVRRERILDGSDVRTTVMLRNIPNKLDWMALKAILDDACFGTYDFVYLRIDFKSGCNVGYAFINFADVHGMIALIDKIERRCWKGFHSTKAAEISYATIQGREALIGKFRNSSVMQETPFCRPRLFLTYIDAEITKQLRYTGTEQFFPRPDNLSKLQRSMDSARTIGLFPPHGYSSVTEHRNRTSAYDRGTPRDMQQAAMHYAQQRAAPGSIPYLTEDQKNEVVAWYATNYGAGLGGPVPFDYIPMTHVCQYLQDPNTTPPVQNVGVVGGPAYVGGVINTPVNNQTMQQAMQQFHLLANAPVPAPRYHYAVRHGSKQINNPFN